MAADPASPKLTLLCFAENAGRSDVERRHRVALLLELNRQGVVAELATVGKEKFNLLRLQNWDKLKGFRLAMENPHDLGAGVIKVKAIAAKKTYDIVWGLDPIGNRYALLAQQLMKSAARAVSIEQPDPPKGLFARFMDRLGASPELTVARTLHAFRVLTGGGKERALVNISPGIDITRVRNRATPGEVKASRKRVGVGVDDLLIAAWVKDAEPTAIARLLTVADAAGARLLVFGEPQQAVVWPRDSLHFTADDYLGYLPLVASSNAYLALGSDAEDILARREATAVGCAVFLFDEMGVVNEAASVFIAPASDSDLLAAIRSSDTSNATQRAEAARLHAAAEYDVKEEARRLVALFTRAESA